MPEAQGIAIPMKIILFFLKHSRKAVIISMIAGIFSGACNAALLAVINLALKNRGPSTTLIGMFGALCLMLPLARFTSELLLTRLGQEAMYTTRMKLCEQVLGASLRHLETLGPARLLTTLTDDIPTITGALNVIPLLCVNAALVIGCLVYMATLSWLFFAIIMSFMFLGIASYQIPIIKVQKLFQIGRKDADALVGHLRALTQGMKELKIHHKRRQAFIESQLKATAKSLMENNIQALKTYSIAASWGQTLVFIVIGIYLVFPVAVSHSSTATLTGYTLALLYLMTPLQVIINSLPQLGRANVALRTVQELGFNLARGSEAPVLLPDVSAGGWQKLKLKSVTHTYSREDESENFTLGPIDLSIEPGELIFITGGNGSGKTTLIKLIAGLYLPESGQIEFNGSPVAGPDQESYRQYFSVVFSDFHLFERLLGLDSAEIEANAQRYLAELKLSHKVRIADGKLSTTDLSQGQRKRLALLTAYLEDRPIYIFDEWAADQDPYFKSVFYMHMLPELRARGKTVLVISHDDRYYGVADRMIKLEEGRVVSDSTQLTEPVEMSPGRSDA